MSISLSPIQNQIITTLKNARNLRYSEIQPKDIPNDLFNYHLQFLVKKGFVDKNEEGYTLSVVGIKHVADPHPLTNSPEIASLFKVNVLTVVSRLIDGKLEILNQLRRSNPSYGKIGVMGGIVRKGERTEDAARRKIKVETGLEADFKIVGMERRIMYVKNELFSDVLFPIGYADEYEGELIDTEYGKNMWVPIDQAIKNESAEFDNLPILIPILKAIKDRVIHSLPFLYLEDIQSGEFKP